MNKIICKICSDEIPIKGFSSHLKNHSLTSEEYYNKYLKKDNEGICLNCGNKTKFIKQSKGYRIYCSISCAQNSDKIKEKKKQTNLKNIGVEYPTQSNDIINKRKNNFLTNHGVYHQMELYEIKNKIKKTNIKKYGVENPFQSDTVKEKIKQTNIKKYGFTNPNKNNVIKNKIKKSFFNKFLESLNKQLKYLNLELLDKYINSHYKHNWKCLKCNFKFIQMWNEIQQGYLCPNCYPRNCGYSKGEKEISEFIKIQNIKIIENSKNIITPYELDIYIPDKNIAIEFDGLYWHSEIFDKDKYYHYHLNKTEECLKNNIQLIHIFEDEWIYKQEIVKSRLKQILNLNDSIRIHSRKCKIKEISPKLKNEFLNKFHLQGKDNSNIKLGAFYNDELISVMTFSKGNISKGSKSHENIWELNRFCSNYNYHIPGIASKLLSYFKNNYNWEEIFSYADRRWSTGNLYYKLGFELEHITKPNYWYIRDGIRIHRFNLRKKSNEPKDTPEWVLRQKEGYYRIWDCGHYKFIMRK